MRLSEMRALMNCAFVWAERSTCSRAHVGAVVARDGRILVTGYNGAPSGMDHCRHSEDPLSPCTVSVHAESNVIAFAARHGIALNGTTLYCTHEPCTSCSKLLINAGIRTVIYCKPYRDGGSELLKKGGVQVLTGGQLC